MNTPSAPRTKAGLTLLEAERRIDSLETAAAKAMLVLAEILKHETLLHEHGDALVSCVELLFDEFKLEGLKHNEFVANSLGRTKHAVVELRKTLAKHRQGESK